MSRGTPAVGRVGARRGEEEHRACGPAGREGSRRPPDQHTGKLGWCCDDNRLGGAWRCWWPRGAVSGWPRYNSPPKCRPSAVYSHLGQAVQAVRHVAVRRGSTQVELAAAVVGAAGAVGARCVRPPSASFVSVIIPVLFVLREGLDDVVRAALARPRQCRPGRRRQRGVTAPLKSSRARARVWPEIRGTGFKSRSGFIVPRSLSAACS